MKNTIRLLLCAVLWIAGASLAAGGRPMYQGPLENDFAAIEATVPGFAGWYFDKEGNVVVRLKDTGRQSEAFAHIGKIVDARLAREPQAFARRRPSFGARAAAYSFSELAQFRDAIKRGLPAPVRQIDIDEVRNALFLGVAEPRDIGEVMKTAVQRGIPPAALIVEVVEIPRTRLSLGDYQRPLRGGTGFDFNWSGACTVGMNGYHTRTVDVGFVTASHCTTTTWAGTGNYAYQAYYGTYLVGIEYDDPAPQPYPTNSWCPNPSGTSFPSNMVCRWSDSAFYIYTDSTANGGATIHTTTYSNGGMAGSTTINGYLPVTGEPLYPLVGSTVHKMGFVSGWTTANLNRTCVDTFHPDDTPNNEPVLLLCQDTTSLFVSPGDSGAPVYMKFSDHVDWLGIMWGEDAYETWHSPAWNVRLDLQGFSY